MKRNKHVLVFILIMASIIGFAQQDLTNKQYDLLISNTEPSFPKGDFELFMFVIRNVNYSDESKKKRVEGGVTLTFDVDVDSTVSNIKVIDSIGFGIDSEVKRLIKNLKFSPAIENGVFVRKNTEFSFPIIAH